MTYALVALTLTINVFSGPQAQSKCWELRPIMAAMMNAPIDKLKCVLQQRV